MKAENPREWLRLLRIRLGGITAKELADLVGVSRQSLHRWEDATSKYVPGLAQAATLAKMAGTTVDEVARIFGAATA